MKANFATCIFREVPGDCGNHVGRRECSASDWEILKCYVDHYGNTLVKDAPIRLMDSLVHILLSNEEVDEDV